MKIINFSLSEKMRTSFPDLEKVNDNNANKMKCTKIIYQLLLSWSKRFRNSVSSCGYAHLCPSFIIDASFCDVSPNNKTIWFWNCSSKFMSDFSSSLNFVIAIFCFVLFGEGERERMLFFRIDFKIIHVHSMDARASIYVCLSVCIDFALMNTCNKLYHANIKSGEQCTKRDAFPGESGVAVRIYLYAQFFNAFRFCFRYLFRIFMISFFGFFTFFPFKSNESPLRFAVYFLCVHFIKIVHFVGCLRHTIKLRGIVHIYAQVWVSDAHKPSATCSVGF